MQNNIFNAKYVRKVADATSTRKNKYDIRGFIDGVEFVFQSAYVQNMKSERKVGDKVFLAKMEPQAKNGIYLWAIHEIKLPVCNYWYSYYEKETDPKKKRMLKEALINHPKTWFGRTSFVVEMSKVTRK